MFKDKIEAKKYYLSFILILWIIITILGTILMTNANEKLYIPGDIYPSDQAALHLNFFSINNLFKLNYVTGAAKINTDGVAIGGMITIISFSIFTIISSWFYVYYVKIDIKKSYLVLNVVPIAIVVMLSIFISRLNNMTTAIDINGMQSSVDFLIGDINDVLIVISNGKEYYYWTNSLVGNYVYTLGHASPAKIIINIIGCTNWVSFIFIAIRVDRENKKDKKRKMDENLIEIAKNMQDQNNQ
ncbi:hypothetical protein STIUS_v1c01880 [Spiroplasma sp. TIUS-1]|uniref:hypothetical protein n=1 Tax=Spiroplasma sp. TIUS-1 TaxID=216963 RepID=UPI0013986D9C|nr:hypothetical protein [Spiroplasma sp. TIUS-1]QHX35743.1 hypothetical protein STIUS_v1c01880 [Spiroplasma sp. TIUS-1]